MPSMDAAQRPARSRRNWKRQVAWLVATVVVLTVVIQFRATEGDRPARAESNSTHLARKSKRANMPRVGHPQHDVMALVNGKDISRQDLMDASVRRFGRDVLESLVNKRLILSHCQKRGINITNEDIHSEINRMAKRFKLGREQWLEMLEKERGISPQEYARDIVWPTLALRKLAAEDIEVSKEEIERAYEQEYGEMVRARLIAVGNADLARQIHARVTANPDSFARAAIEHSIDVNSASVGGLIQPIRRHVGDLAIEEEAFRLEPGKISAIIQAAGQHILLKCEGRIESRNIDRAEVQKQIVEKIKDQKLRKEAHQLFGRLQRPATIQNVYNDPQLRETMPGVVATVNGDRITMKELGHECLLRHGEEVLETEISRVLLEQSLKKANLTITEVDLEEEVKHAAVLAGAVDSDGKADLAKWYQAVEKEQETSRAQYMRVAVWPSAALKKLTVEDVQVTQEDLQKAFEANFGERVRCKAIVLGTMRRAQEVWDKARRNPSVDYFGDLAAEYSIEPTSKALRGEVPPLQRYSGQPQLELAAFQLEPDQLSGIVQVGDKFIILRCEGRTKRINIDLPEVRETLFRDIYEKKLRLAMSNKFAQIRKHSRVDNYLAGTSDAPVERSPKIQAGIRRDVAVRSVSAEQ